MADSLIKITNIKRDFPLGNEIVYVLKGIDLDIKKGEYVALMGPSGSGKSTLMNILGCLDTPTSGTYILNGKHVSEMQDDELAGIRNKEIGFVFQTFNLMPRTTALDNVALPMVYAGFSTQEGYVIVIEHADGFVSSYKHAKAVLKKQGDKVQVSDPVAIVGNYGSTYKEPHIHFELWLNQSSVNPADYIRF